MTEVDAEFVKQDVDAVFHAAQLCCSVRFAHKRFWEEESVENKYCERIYAGKPRLESVADHSWHVADAVLIIGPRFPALDLAKGTMLAVLHDKLELWSGDASPLGRNGDGTKSFAFNAVAQQSRSEAEREAGRRYLETLSGLTLDFQRNLINELLQDETVAAQFVRAIDKLQVFVYLIRRKAGKMSDQHIAFNLRYALKYVSRVDGLRPYYDEMVHRLLEIVAAQRGQDLGALKLQFRDSIEPAQRELGL